MKAKSILNIYRPDKFEYLELELNVEILFDRVSGERDNMSLL